jgi:Spy/CpxP family protein refolding chaperone
MGYDAGDEYCPGCAIMGDHGMGPGMMGGHGMGPGVMGGYGMGPGIMGADPTGGRELSRDEQKRMARIETELRRHNWELQGKIIDARGELLQLFTEETLDPRKIGAAYGRIFDLRRQMIEATIEARNRQRAILTDEPQEKVRADTDNGGGDENYLRDYGGMGQ